MSESRISGALEGIRVLDLTRALAGPFCTMLLADMGAEVIKIEVPNKGDDTRCFPPFYKRDDGYSESAYFININRNKKSIALNLKEHKERDIFLKLVAKSDVVAENYKPGVMEGFGLGYSVLKEINPGVIYAAISGFGQYGPYSDREAYDLIGQAMGGMMSVTGWPGGPPTRTGTAIADILAALYCCVGILAALRAREVMGIGQMIDVALMDSVVAAHPAINQLYIVEGRVPSRIGNRYEFTYPYDSFKAADGWLTLATANDELWRKLCYLIGEEGLVEDTRFDTMEKRVSNHALIKPIVEKWTSQRKKDEAISTLREHGIPAAPILSIDEVVKDPHMKAREMFVDLEHPRLGKVKLSGCPIKMSVTKPTVKTPAPLLNEQGKDILARLLDD